MIPTFPNFKKIELSDKPCIEAFTNDFPPYSDYNFVSMWAWNTRDKMRVSQLHGNLVLLFIDYVSETPFLSFIGMNDLANTAHELIEYSKRWYYTGALKLIPEEVAKQLPNDNFLVLPDEDSNDYILSIQFLSSLDTLPRSYDKARLCKKFLRLYPQHVIQKHSIKEDIGEKCIDLFRSWAKVKNLDHRELNEYSAFERFILNKDNETTILSIHDDENMMGFIAYEIISSKYATSHFSKANVQYAGIYDALNFFAGKSLQERNIEYINFEQDLGLPSLRALKSRYKPEFYLKKFVVEKRT